MWSCAACKEKAAYLMDAASSALGRPVTSKIRSIWFIVELPGQDKTKECEPTQRNHGNAPPHSHCQPTIRTRVPQPAWCSTRQCGHKPHPPRSSLLCPLVTRTWENGFAGEHLSQYAAQGPHVHALRVLCRPQQDFGRTVPPCRDIVRQRLCTTRRWHLGQSDKNQGNDDDDRRPQRPGSR